MKLLLFLVLIVIQISNNNGKNLNNLKAFRTYFSEPVTVQTTTEVLRRKIHRQRNLNKPFHVQEKGKDLPAISQHGNYFDEIRDFVTDKETELKHPDPNQMYHEYVYGDCLDDNRYPYATVNLNPNQLNRRAIIRGWMNIRNLPTCVIITGSGHIEHISRTAAFNFQICVARVTYIYNKRGYRYYYYEWYIPKDISKSLSWNMRFFGPDEDAWGKI